MNMHRKISIGAFAVFAILSAFSATSFAMALKMPANYSGDPANDKVGKYFTDVTDSHPFAASVDAIKEMGMVQGYGDKTFKPDSTISRAEFIKILVASLVTNPTGANCFRDVKDEWFAKYVCTAKAKGFISGYGDGSFRPQNNINFAEASKVLTKAYGFKVSSSKANEPWYKPAVSRLAAVSAIPASIDYTDKKLSRGEVAEMIWRLKTKTKNKPTKKIASFESDFPVLASCGELQDKLAFQKYKSERNRIYLKGTELPMAMMESVGADSASATSEPPPASSPDFSTTNVQVEGVDEADIVKNDGEFIYVLSGNKVHIVKAFPPENMQKISTVELSADNFSASDIYIFQNKLVVLGISYSSGSKTKIFVVDIADKANPKEERSIEFDGNLVSSRRIDGKLFIVANQYPSYYGPMETISDAQKVLPKYKDSAAGDVEKPVVGCTQIHFIPRYDQPNFLTVASFDITNPESAISKEVIMGSGETVYASAESLYIAGTQYSYPEAQVFDVFAPPVSDETTNVFRFGISDGAIAFKGKGSVKGHLLNQFAMDENGEALRVATTVGEVWNAGDSKAKNNVYILDRNNMGTVLGKIENIAPGEKIYSVRFLGNRAYMVTFKKIDPFFVIDVADPSAPKILGELKIPGFSDYLHPFDENHIIGFGKDAVDPQEPGMEGVWRGFDFAWYQGMKIALFDVTDVANPKVMFTELIGDRGTDSEVLTNHRALLYDKTRNLFALPVTVNEVSAEEKAKGNGYTGSTYGTPIFQGAYVYTLDLVNGFKLLGKVKHYEGDKFPTQCNNNGISAQEYCWSDVKPQDVVKRILRIGEFIYTLSPGKIKSSKIENVEEVKSLDLPFETEKPTYIMY